MLLSAIHSFEVSEDKLIQDENGLSYLQGPCLYEEKHLNLPELGLRGEIPPSRRILCIFISRLQDECNTTRISPE